VGWSGIAPVTMLIENIIGLRFDASKNTVTFDMFPGKTCGLRNMLFNGGKISVECTEYIPVAGQSTICVEAEKSFKLIVKNNYAWGEYSFDVPAGKHIFRV
jgi:hypothetical protein